MARKQATNAAKVARPNPRARVALTEIQYLEFRLADLEEELDEAREDKSHQAYVAGCRLAANMRKELAALQADESAKIAAEQSANTELSLDEQIAAIKEALAGLPAVLLDDVLDHVGADRRAPPGDGP